jgi:hypothetical protein
VVGYVDGYNSLRCSEDGKIDGGSHVKVAGVKRNNVGSGIEQNPKTQPSPTSIPEDW